MCQCPEQSESTGSSHSTPDHVDGLFSSITPTSSQIIRPPVVTPPSVPRQRGYDHGIVSVGRAIGTQNCSERQNCAEMWLERPTGDLRVDADFRIELVV